MNPYTCRNAQVSDAPGIAHVQVQTWRTAYKGIIDEETLNSLSTTEKTKFWQWAIEEGGLVAVVKKDDTGDVLGFVNYGKHRDDKSKGHIYALYVLEEYQGKGIGKLLLQEAFNVLKQMEYNGALLWVLKHNPHKIFYTRMGGQVAATQVIQIGNTQCEEECMEFSF